MINVLITPVEVIEKGAFDRNMDPLLIEPFIQLAEYRHLASHNSFFGMELYKLLLQDGVSYANYRSTSIYAVDAVVIYGGKYYKCTVAGTTGILPTVSANWVPVSKFANPEYQKLWDLHLWKYIAFAVQHNSTFKNSYRSTSKGVMRNEGETSKPAAF